MELQIDSLASDDLLQFFHRKKTELSCMKNPITFLRQLADHNLIPKATLKKVSHMKSKESVKRGVYEALEWLERERSEHIRLFWRCVLEDTIINQYPTLRLLRRSIMDGSFRENMRLFEKVEKKKMNGNKRKEVSDEDEDMQPESVKKKKPRNVRLINNDDDDDDDEQQQRTPRQKKNSKKEEKKNLRSGRVLGGDDDEQPGPSSRSSPARSGSSSSSMEKEEKTNMTVTCGDLQGSLSKGKLARGQRCICFHKRWFTPTEFERRAGKQNSKNWKTSIRCEGVPLGKLIQDGRLASASFKRGHKAKKSSFPPETESNGDDDGNESEESEDEEDQTSSNEEGSTLDTDEEETEQQEVDSRRMTVSCRAVTATLHTKRFASGGRGKSIRTETSWMTPEEFVRQASGQTDACWRKDIVCEGKALGLLLKEKTLKSHSVLCPCALCIPDETDLENQRNDDDCWVCKGDEGAGLVVCDFCPRSFHQTCHLPPVDDAALRDDGPWKCTFCEVASRGTGPELDLQAAGSQLVSGHVLKCQYLLLSLVGADAERTPGAPEWLHDVSKKLQGTDFQTVGEFVSDVQLTLSKVDAELPVQRGSLQELFQREFKKVFKIRD